MARWEEGSLKYNMIRVVAVNKTASTHKTGDRVSQGRTTTVRVGHEPRFQRLQITWPLGHRQEATVSTFRDGWCSNHLTWKTGPTEDQLGVWSTKSGIAKTTNRVAAPTKSNSHARSTSRVWPMSDGCFTTDSHGKWPDHQQVCPTFFSFLVFFMFCRTLTSNIRSHILFHGAKLPEPTPSLNNETRVLPWTTPDSDLTSECRASFAKHICNNRAQRHFTMPQSRQEATARHVGLVSPFQFRFLWTKTENTIMCQFDHNIQPFSSICAIRRHEVLFHSPVAVSGWKPNLIVNISQACSAHLDVAGKFGFLSFHGCSLVLCKPQ